MRRILVLLSTAVICIAVMSWCCPGRAPEAPEKSKPKVILDAVMSPVQDAPGGTYIIEYSNGVIEVLHPDGTRVPLIVAPSDHKVDSDNKESK